MKRDFRPGDRIILDQLNGVTKEWTVLDPPRTSRGKLRLQQPGAKTVMTTWWSHPSTGYRLPPRYRLEEAE